MVISAFLRRTIGVSPGHFGRAVYVSLLLAASTLLLQMHALRLYVSPDDVTVGTHEAGAAELANVRSILPKGCAGFPPWRIVLDGTCLHAVWAQPTSDGSIWVRHRYLNTRPLPLLKPDHIHWGRFCAKLLKQATHEEPSPGRRIWESLRDTPEWDSIVAAAGSRRLLLEDKQDVVNSLNAVLRDPAFYHRQYFEGVRLDEETQHLLSRAREALAEAELVRLNWSLLIAAYPDSTTGPEWDRPEPEDTFWADEGCQKVAGLRVDVGTIKAVLPASGDANAEEGGEASPPRIAVGTKVVSVRWRSAFHDPASLSSLGAVLNWPRFCSKLNRQRTGQASSLGRRIWALLPRDALSAVEDAAGGAQLNNKRKTLVAQALKKILARRGFFRVGDMPYERIPAKAREMLDAKQGGLTARDVGLLNLLLLRAAYPAEVMQGHRYTWQKRCAMRPDRADTWLEVTPGRYRASYVPHLMPLGIDGNGKPVDKLIIDGARPYIYAIFSPIVPLVLGSVLCFGASWREWFRKYVAEALVVNVIATVPAIVWLIAAASVLDVTEPAYVWKIMIFIGLLFVPQAYELMFAVVVRYQRTGRFVSDFCRGFSTSAIFWRHIFGRLVLWARLLRIWASAAGFAVLMDVTLNYLKGSFSCPPSSTPSWGQLIKTSGSRLCQLDFGQQNVLVFASTAGAIVLLILTSYCLSDFILSCERKLDV